jgi:hypothetical protein
MDVPHESTVMVDGMEVSLGEALNTHTGRLACQTCHIPTYARGGLATKMFWDWSTAGVKNEEGGILTLKDENGNPTYDTRKGDFVWESNVIPEYVWFNGTVTYVTLDDTVDPEQGVNINTLHGERSDPEARIFPIKVFRGIQPYDAGNNTLAIPHLFGKDEAAYWKSYDWAMALTAGMASVGREFSGEVGYIETEMVWVQNHMVAPAADALQCGDCHTADGRLDFAALGYNGEEVALLTVFPPVAPEPTEVPVEPTAVPTEEPAPTDVPVEPVEEEPAAEPELIQEPVAEPVPAGESEASNAWMYWLGGIIVVALGGFAWMRRQR